MHRQGCSTNLVATLFTAALAVWVFGTSGGAAVGPPRPRPCAPRDFGRGSVVCVCNATYCDDLPRPTPAPAPAKQPPGPGRHSALLYTTSRAGLRFHQTPLLFVDNHSDSNTDYLFTVNSSRRFQSVRGWGATVTDSAGINIYQLSPEARSQLFRSYFSDEGIEYNILRVPIGGTDCSLHKYTLHDEPGDESLPAFNLTKEDFLYKIPVVRDAVRVAARPVKLMASAWTAPPWMKTNNDYTGFGFLKKQYYQAWVDYHVKFFDAYKEEGLTFWAMTTGNEPMNGIAGPLIRFNSMGWTPLSAREWIGDNLGPALRASPHRDVLILALDDQRMTLPWWTAMVLTRSKADEYVDGIAVHWYTDYFTPTLGLDLTNWAHPNKFILGTEASSGFNNWDLEKVILGSWSRAVDYFIDILDDLNHWVTGWMEWSLVLDTEGGPSWSRNFVDTSILVNATADEFLKQPTFYAIGHFSKFVPPESVRVLVSPDSSGFGKSVRNVGFVRPDGATVVIVYNSLTTEANVTVADDSRGYVSMSLPAESFNTLIYW